MYVYVIHIYTHMSIYSCLSLSLSLALYICFAAGPKPGERYTIY